MHQNFLYQERLKTWESWRFRYKGKLRTVSDVEKACGRMLESLMDEYTFFRDTRSTGERKAESSSKNVVSAKLLPGSIGYLKISTFSSRACVSEARSALKTLTRASAYVLDLRDNWGGSIDDAFSVYQMLARDGVFVKMSGREDSDPYDETLSIDDGAAQRLKNGDAMRMPREPCLCGTAPIAVLINENTKSAAEMLAGALKDSRRAILVGDKTFGKGVVQQVWEFDNGTSVKITSARFYLPSGQMVHGVGLNPDFRVSKAGSRDSQLTRAVLIAGSNLRRKMANRREGRPATAVLRSHLSASGEDQNR